MQKLSQVLFWAVQLDQVWETKSLLIALQKLSQQGNRKRLTSLLNVLTKKRLKNISKSW